MFQILTTDITIPYAVLEELLEELQLQTGSHSTSIHDIFYEHYQWDCTQSGGDLIQFEPLTKTMDALAPLQDILRNIFVHFALRGCSVTYLQTNGLTYDIYKAVLTGSRVALKRASIHWVSIEDEEFVL